MKVKGRSHTQEKVALQNYCDICDGVHLKNEASQ
jgi:hypothetical protein